MGGIGVVLCTVKNRAEAGRIADSLVAEKLAACVSIIGGVRSVYRWQGRIMRSAETLLVIKTKKKLFADLCRVVRRNHSYACPEIILLPVEAGFDAYLRWVSAQTAC